jgi:hypothetical protein
MQHGAGLEVASKMAGTRLDQASGLANCSLATRRSRKAACAGRIFVFAASRGNQSARSTSGSGWRRPLLGGHSISNELLTRFAGSKSLFPENAITGFPPRWRISPSGRNAPIEASGPSSSANSRRAARSGSPSTSISPFGIDQALRPCSARTALRDAQGALQAPPHVRDRPGCQR